MNKYFCWVQNQFVCFWLRNSIEMHVVLLAIQLYSYFTQSPSCIMTCSFALTKAWYRIAHGKVTSWLSFPGFKNNPPIFWSFFVVLFFLRSVLACFKLLNGHAEGSAA